VTLTEWAREDWRNIRRYLRRKFSPQAEMAIAAQVRAARIAIGENKTMESGIRSNQRCFRICAASWSKNR